MYETAPKPTASTQLRIAWYSSFVKPHRPARTLTIRNREPSPEEDGPADRTRSTRRTLHLRLGDPLEHVHADEAGVGAQDVAGDGEQHAHWGERWMKG